MKLTIAIPTLACRQPLLDRLLRVLQPQLTDDVQLLVDADDGQLTIGAKRQRLLDRAVGDYLWQLDDDDLVAADAVPRVLAALADRPTHVGFNAARFEEGREIGSTIYSCRYPPVFTYTPPTFVRPITPICPIQRDLARAAGYPNIDRGEDLEYARRLSPVLKLEGEAFITGPAVYLYLFRCQRPGEQQAIDRSRRQARRRKIV